MVGDSAVQTSDGWEILDLWVSGEKLNDKPPWEASMLLKLVKAKIYVHTN